LSKTGFEFKFPFLLFLILFFMMLFKTTWNFYFRPPKAAIPREFHGTKGFLGTFLRVPPACQNEKIILYYTWKKKFT